MPQPQLLRINGRGVAKFGNLAQPNGQGVLANIDLNDYVNTALDPPALDDTTHQLSLAQLLYRARSAFVAEDYGPRLIPLKMLYLEDATHFLGDFTARLAMAGEQQLTFDNATAINVRYQGIAQRTLNRPQRSLAWDFMLNLLARNPFFSDIAQSSFAAQSTSPDAGASIAVVYNGTVWAEPVLTYTVAGGNAAPINALQITNAIGGSTQSALTVNFLSVAAIPAGVARTVTIDCAAQTAVDNLGNNYDVSGSFPLLIGPPGTTNTLSVVTSVASGASTATLAGAWNNRWML